MCVCYVCRPQIKSSAVWSSLQWNVWGFTGTKLEWQTQAPRSDLPRGETALVSKNRSIVLCGESPPLNIFTIWRDSSLMCRGRADNKGAERIRIRGTQGLWLVYRETQVVHLNTWKAFNRCTWNSRLLLRFLRNHTHKIQSTTVNSVLVCSENVMLWGLYGRWNCYTIIFSCLDKYCVYLLQPDSEAIHYFMKHWTQVLK